MDQGEQVATDATGFRSDHSLSSRRGDGGVDGVPTGPKDGHRRLGREVMRGRDCPVQDVLRSGSERFKASSTARTTALDSSSST
jgi:hypothetical protein